MVGVECVPNCVKQCSLFENNFSFQIIFLTVVSLGLDRKFIFLSILNDSIRVQFWVLNQKRTIMTSWMFQLRLLDGQYNFLHKKDFWVELLPPVSEGWPKVMSLVCSHGGGTLVRFPVLSPNSGPRSFLGVPQSLVPCQFWGYPSLWSHVHSGGTPVVSLGMPPEWTGVTLPWLGLGSHLPRTRQSPPPWARLHCRWYDTCSFP